MGCKAAMSAEIDTKGHKRLDWHSAMSTLNLFIGLYGGSGFTRLAVIISVR